MTSLSSAVSAASELGGLIPPSQRPARLMGATLVGMGVVHFAAPAPFDSLVPRELPGDARLYTHASGVAEVATGVLLLVPRTRRLGAAAAIALYVGVFPANVNMVRLWWRKGWPARIAAIARLPLQVPMITAARKIYRNAPR